jgi:hypothetical protein
MRFNAGHFDPRDTDTNRLQRYASTMRSQILVIVLLGITLLAPLKTWAQEPATATVTIRVTDQVGTPILGAQIRLGPVSDPTAIKLQTDSQGDVSLDLKPGGYPLVVSDPGFKTWSERIYVAAPRGEASARQLFPVALQIGAVSSPAPIYPKDTLVLSADAYHIPVVLSPADFRALPHVTITVHNSHTDADESFSGVPLATLLAMVSAPIGKELQKEALSNYIVAYGTDGYSVVLSLAEVDPSFHGGQVLVADARNGQPLANSGPFQLIVSEDKRPARWVHNLIFITLQSLH